MLRRLVPALFFTLAASGGALIADERDAPAFDPGVAMIEQIPAHAVPPRGLSTVGIVQNGAGNLAEVRQQGAGLNSAGVYQEGAENSLFLTQNATSQPPAGNSFSGRQIGAGNAATTFQQGRGLIAILQQYGDGNTASQFQQGRSDTARLYQDGDNNSATQTQIGNNLSSTISQFNDNNTAVSTQIGNNLPPVVITQFGGASVMVTYQGGAP